MSEANDRIKNAARLLGEAADEAELAAKAAGPREKLGALHWANILTGLAGLIHQPDLWEECVPSLSAQTDAIAQRGRERLLHLEIQNERPN